MIRMSTPCLLSSIVTESTRYGMSSVTMFDHGPRPGERGPGLGADPDDRAALRPVGAERRMPVRRQGQPCRAGHDQVLDGDAPVIRGEEAGKVVAHR